MNSLSAGSTARGFLKEKMCILKGGDALLTLILGRAGTGKTMHVMNDIKKRGDMGETELLLIVPEQYSHSAERQLSDVCGDRLSMYGETMSFTRLCGRVFSQMGGAPVYILDSGGQILIMYRAIESLTPNLKVFGTKGQRIQFLEKLLETINEFKSLNISPQTLERMAALTTNPLRDKLRDLSLIFNAYDALLHAHGCDNSDRLTLLADMIEDSTLGEIGHIYFDGFNDFTAQELRIIENLMRKNAQLTICLTCDLLSEEGEIFELPHNTVGRLRRLADECGIEVKVRGSEEREVERGEKSEHRDDAVAEELVHLEKHFFEHTMKEFPNQCNAIRVYSAPTRYTECEYAAYITWQMVRKGYRWCDIGVVARDWDEYGSICENVFEKYDVPFFSSGRADILSKPPVALIDAALEIAVSGWEYKPVFRYLKTGLLGITADDCAELENYVLKWNIRGTMWAREWTLPPYTYGKEDYSAALARLNSLRSLITEPLFTLRDRIKDAAETGEKLRALNSFFEDIKFPERLKEKADSFEKRGEVRLAEEYAQLWEIIINAMEQFYSILAGAPISAVEFKKIFSLALSRYDIGVIPVALDRTALGSMAMSRRRDLKCLIVLGATDGNIPLLAKRGGTLSDSEREELLMLGVDMPAGIGERFSREMNMLYSTLTLPSRKLVITYPVDGEERPSFIVKRMMAMFGIDAITLREQEYMTVAMTPLSELALMNANKSAERGKLSEGYAERLYTRELQLSASSVDRYYSCPFQHFLKTGLRLAPRIPAGFDAPEAGVFMHYILEGVSREIQSSVGLKNADDDLCRSLTMRYIEQYVNDELFGFEGKNARFIYLFRRMEEDVIRIVLDMLEELKKSDFEPLDFELDFSDLCDRSRQPVVGGADETTPRSSHSAPGVVGITPLKLRGIIDRVDGWEREGKLYLRVIDYKTGKMPFNLPDILYGRNMQMLIYLFALQEYGDAKYGKKITPAGVLYIPARVSILNLPRGTTEEEILRKHLKELRRGGLVLDDPFVLEAMENGDAKTYLPVSVKKGGITGDSLVSPDQITLLSAHIIHMLRRAAGDILGGRIECIPYYKSEDSNACLYCEYRAVCAFDENSGDRRRFARKMKTSEVWEELKMETGADYEQ